MPFFKARERVYRWTIVPTVWCQWQLTAESRKSRIRSTVHPSIYWVICMCSYADGATERTVTTGIWENARLIAYAATARLTSITSIVAAGQEQKIALRGSWTRCEEFSQCRDVLVLEKKRWALFLHPHPTQKKAKHHQLEVSQVFQRKKGWDPLFALEIRTWHPVNPLGSPKAPAAVWKKSGRAPGVDFLPIQVGKMMNQLGKLVVFFFIIHIFFISKNESWQPKIHVFFALGSFVVLVKRFVDSPGNIPLKFPRRSRSPKKAKGETGTPKETKAKSTPEIEQVGLIGWLLWLPMFRWWLYIGLVGMQTQTSLAFEKKIIWRSFNSSEWKKNKTKLPPQKNEFSHFSGWFLPFLAKKAKLEALEKLRKLQSVEPKEARAKEWRALYGSQLWFFFWGRYQPLSLMRYENSPLNHLKSFRIHEE